MYTLTPRNSDGTWTSFRPLLRKTAAPADLRNGNLVYAAGVIVYRRNSGKKSCRRG